jgi:hypothetical protein
VAVDGRELLSPPVNTVVIAFTRQRSRGRFQPRRLLDLAI